MVERSAKDRDLVIYTEASPAIGAGHLVRCSAYAEAWAELGGSVRWIIAGDRTFSQRFLSAESDARFAPWTQRPACDGQAEVAIVDSYHATVEALRGIARNCSESAALDDLCSRDYPVDFVVHASPGPMQMTASEQAVWLCGPDWQPLRSAFSNLPVRMTRRLVERIVILMGGSDIRELASWAAATARRVYPHARVVIVGQSGPVAEPGIDYQRDLSALEMAALFAGADMAISAAGQTTFELASAGTPAILVGVAENQQGHLRHWPETGANVSVGMWNEPGLDDRLLEALLNLENTAVRHAMAVAGQALVDGRGALRLFERMGYAVH